MTDSRFLKVGILCLWCVLLCSSGSLLAQAVPVIYDDFSDGRWENRTGTDPWGRPLPEWSFYAHSTYYQTALSAISASGGYLSYEYHKGCRVSIPSTTAYGTWEWKYRFPNGRTEYTGAAANYFFVNPTMDASGNYYFRGLVSDGHTWFGRNDVHLLHNEEGGWGTGLFVENRWHVCRITRDPVDGFTIYHDNRIIGSGYGHGLFTGVVDNTYTTSVSFDMTMSTGSTPPGIIDVDDIKIYNTPIAASTTTSLRHLCAIADGTDPSTLPAWVNRAGASMGATTSGGATGANPGQAPDHMIDGVTTDYSGGSGYGYGKGSGADRLVVELAEARPIEELYISLWDLPEPHLTRKFPNPRMYDIKVEVSVDGIEWTTVAESDWVCQIQKISLGGMEVRYIRMGGQYYKEYLYGKYPTPPEIEGVYDEIFVVEFEAYEVPEPATMVLLAIGAAALIRRRPWNLSE